MTHSAPSPATKDASLESVHFDSTPVVSGITGRTVLVNYDESRFAVLPGFDPSVLAHVRAEWDAHIESELGRRAESTYWIRTGRRPYPGAIGAGPAMRAVIERCFVARTATEFAHALEPVIAMAEATADPRGTSKRCFELLVLLWRHGLIALPAGWAWRPFGPELPDVTERFYGRLTPAFAAMMDETEAYRRAYEGADLRKGTRYTRLLVLACGRAVSIGDVAMTALEGFAAFLPSPPKGRNAVVCDMLRAMQLVAHADQPDVLRRIPPSYRAALRAPSDLTLDRFTDEDTQTLPADAAWAHLEPTAVTSAITERTVHVNYDAVRYAVLPDFSLERLAAARADWESEASRSGRKLGTISSATLERIASCFRARTRQGLAVGVERLLARRALKVRQYQAGEDPTAERIKAGDASRISETLLLLWKHNLVAFPAGEVWGATSVKFGTMGELTEHFYGPLASVIRTLDASPRWGAGGRRVPRLVFLVCGGLQEIGDMDAAVLEGLVPFAAAAEQGAPRQFPRTVNILCDQLRSLQLQVYADDSAKLAAIPQSYRSIFRPSTPGKSDPAFGWAATLGPRVARWRECVTAYVASLPNRVTRRAEITTFNILLEYVDAHVDVSADPLDYCRRAYRPRVTFEAYFRERDASDFHVNSTMRRVGLFLGWLLEREIMDEDGYISREYHNPHDPESLARTSYSRGQTHRTAVPVRYLRMMREIIEENDFEWPRSLKQDYIEWLNPATGVLEPVWSPVRALFFLLRLHLPLRGMQVRLLDSGEGDAEVFRPDQGGWVANTGRWVPRAGETKLSMGFIRRIWDHQMGKPFNGLYITTNKTADRVAGFVESGYEIPWENPEVIDLFTRLRDWQEAYNPSQRPMTRSELSDKGLSASEDVALRLQKLHFLFRDPANGALPMEPVSSGRLQNFWCRLVAELERRLAARGVTSYDGSPIQLITKYTHDTVPSGTIFDPHSLRVAGLTALAAAGVPLHILSEFVAGHATVLMTLYYQKPGASEITRLLDEAAVKMAELEQRQWAAYLKDQPLDLLEDLAAYNSPEGAAAAASVQSGLWSPLDDGICPNGGTKCAVGGPLIDSRKQVHQAVPGGARNCVLCRFFVTGPAYLAGLVAKFNATAGAIREAIMRVQRLSLRRRELVKAQLAAEREHRRFDEHRQLVRAEEELAKAEGEIDVLSQTWMAQLRLIRRCEALLEQRLQNQAATGGAASPEAPSDGTRNALVLTGSVADLRVSLESCSEFDLWDRICESTEFFEGIDARVPALRRGRLFDAMLAREGRPALFATLTDEQLVAVGNEATRLLRAQLGAADLNDLIAGRTTLEALGVTRLFDQMAGAVGAPVTIAAPGRALPTQVPLHLPVLPASTILTT